MVQDQASGPGAAQLPGTELTGFFCCLGEVVGFLLTQKCSSGKIESDLLYALVKLQLHCLGAFQQSASLTKQVQNEHTATPVSRHFRHCAAEEISALLFTPL